jgi:hypothetical protein
MVLAHCWLFNVTGYGLRVMGFYKGGFFCLELGFNGFNDLQD